ncbi:putative porin [bacterium]|nr:putative porin [bacterium]
MRYETGKTKGSVTRNREFFSFRYGFETDINEDLKIGARLATGGNNPRTTWQTMGNSFETKDINLDKAYFEYTPFEGVRILGGKFNDEAIFTTNDWLFDSDYTFEGQSLCLSKDISDDFGVFFNTGAFVLDEIAGSNHDPYMVYAQPGIKGNLSSALSYKAGLAYYVFGNTVGNNLDYTSNSNTLDGTSLKHRYNVLNPNTILTYNLGDSDYAVSALGEYSYNDAPGDFGYLLGAKIGHKKVKNPNSWQIGYNWRYLERDAFLDAFPNASAYGGQTNIKGHAFCGSYALTENVVTSFTYYRIRGIDGDDESDNRLQVDLAFSF